MGKKYFGDEFYKKVDNDVNLVKQKLKNPIQTSKEQWNSISPKEQKLIKFIFIFPLVIIVTLGIIMSLLFLFSAIV